MSRYLAPMLVLLSLGLIKPLPVGSEPSTEAAVKTAFLFNFFKFIEWPQENDLQNFLLCTSHSDLGDTLLTLMDKTVKKKPLQILREPDISELKKCQIVYIGESEQAVAIADELKNLPIVTVSAVNNFAANGGIIGFVIDQNRLSFEINLKAANITKLHINAKLLKLAKQVYVE